MPHMGYQRPGILYEHTLLPQRISRRVVWKQKGFDVRITLRSMRESHRRSPQVTTNMFCFASHSFDSVFALTLLRSLVWQQSAYMAASSAEYVRCGCVCGWMRSFHGPLQSVIGFTPQIASQKAKFDSHRCSTACICDQSHVSNS